MEHGTNPGILLVEQVLVPDLNHEQRPGMCLLQLEHLQLERRVRQSAGAEWRLRLLWLWRSLGLALHLAGARGEARHEGLEARVGLVVLLRRRGGFGFRLALLRLDHFDDFFRVVFVLAELVVGYGGRVSVSLQLPQLFDTPCVCERGPVRKRIAGTEESFAEGLMTAGLLRVLMLGMRGGSVLCRRRDEAPLLSSAGRGGRQWRRRTCRVPISVTVQDYR
jgi:hypothetical protein